jgi:glycosyltransferase involved in cell wall biosynthesis
MDYHLMVNNETTPLISVITAVYNGEHYITSCIQNIANQTYKNIEHVIVDGGSTDTTLDIIKAHDKQIDCWISESDNGIGDAMNKGIALAKGDFVIFIHSDDYFSTVTAVEEMVKHIDSNTDILLADVLFGEELKLVKARNFSKLINFKLGFCHQGSVCRRSLFTDIGNFDESFKLTMDYDFFLRAYRRGIRSQSYQQALSVMRDTGVSSQLDWPSLVERFNEEKRVHKKNCDSAFKKIVYAIYWALYMPYRKFKKIM